MYKRTRKFTLRNTQASDLAAGGLRQALPQLGELPSNEPVSSIQPRSWTHKLSAAYSLEKGLALGFRTAAYAILLLVGACLSVRAQENGPLVARLEMKLTLNEKVIDVIEKGDLLTVLSEREKSWVIQTFNGHKGAVAKVNAVRLEESVPIYDELIEENPDVGRLYTLRAGAHWAVGESEKALADYSAAIEHGYDEAQAFSSRGLFYASVGKLDDAIKDYTTAIKKDPDDEIAFINRASVYMSKGDYENAIKDYTSAAKLRPENPILYSQRAVANKLLGKFDDAIADYDQTIELASKDVSAHMGRGFLKFQLGRHEDAIEDFSKAFELSPQSAVAVNNRGYNYQLTGKFKEALEDYSRAAELAPRYLLALQNKGWLLTICEDRELRDPVEAIKTAEAVCELTEYKSVSDLTLLAAAHASAEEFETAIGWQEKAIELASDQQKKVSTKILKLYQDELPLDPKLLDQSAERPPSPRTTRPRK